MQTLVGQPKTDEPNLEAQFYLRWRDKPAKVFSFFMPGFKSCGNLIVPPTTNPGLPGLSSEPTKPMDV